MDNTSGGPEAALDLVLLASLGLSPSPPWPFTPGSSGQGAAHLGRTLGGSEVMLDSVGPGDAHLGRTLGGFEVTLDLVLTHHARPRSLPSRPSAFAESAASAFVGSAGPLALGLKGYSFPA